MRTEEPTDRAQRRLSGSAADAAGTADEPDDPPDTSLARWLPDAPASSRPQWLTALRADPGRAGVIALSVVGVVAVLVTVLTLAGNDPPPVVSANLPPVQMVSNTPGPPSPGPAAPVVVSVVGLVHKPGLVTLTTGARVDDALAAAGGVLDGADLLGLNVARRVADGEQIVVGISSPPGAPTAMGSSITASPGTAGPPAADDARPAGAGAASVNLNTATVEELDELPGIGPVMAAAIVAWREANGSFSSVDQLGEVDGIGPTRLEKLRNLVHV